MLINVRVNNTVTQKTAALVYEDTRYTPPSTVSEYEQQMQRADNEGIVLSAFMYGVTAHHFL